MENSFGFRDGLSIFEFKMMSMESQPIAIEEQFKIMADSAPVLIWISGTDKLCYFFNQGWLNFTGRIMQQEYGNGWAEGVHPDDLNRCLDIYVSNFDQRKEFRMEYRLKRADGMYRWLLDHGVPRYTSSGDFAGFIGSCIDIDDKKLAEEKLESIVEQRTSELRQAIVELKRSNEELEQFAYAASHDMKEPIRKILVYSQSVLESSAQTPQLIEKIKEAAHRMNALIDDLLDLSRVRKDESLFEQVDLNEVIEDVHNDLELLVLEKKAIIHTTQLPVLSGIKEQLRQLFYNLLSNAIKYSKEEVAPKIEITLNEVPEQIELLDPSKKYIEVILKDNGIGFQQEYAEKIFTIFQRLHGRGKYSGTGVGLALCKKVMQNHEGNIYATSTPGEGSVFHVILPK